MKIAMLGLKCVPSRQGGVEVVVTELAARMAALGHEVTCYNRGGKLGEHPNIRLKTVPTLPFKGLSAVSSSFFAAAAAAFSSADVVHIHAEGPAFWCWIPKLLGKRVVVTIHGLDWQREKWENSFGRVFIRAGEKMAVRFANEIIVLSRNVQRYFREAYGRDTVYIPNGVDLPRKKAVKEIQDVGLEKDGYFLFLGRLVPEKGIHYLIEAFHGVATDKKLVIAGASSDTDGYAAQLKALAQEDDRILFTGFVQGGMLEALYGNAYAYVLPSNLEGMPLSLLEALRYGNCCVVSDIPECAEVVGEYAVMFPRGNIAALRESLQYLCDHPSEVQAYKKAASKAVLGKYNWDDVVEKTLELYHENSADQ